MGKKFLVKISFVLCFLLLSCSGPIRRNHRGDTEVDGAQPIKKRNDYTYVKKKMSLLTFFNESPYGGDDLAVVATEELRGELSRTGQFILDAEGANIFGSSKEIYAGGGSKLVQLAKKAKMAGISFVVFGRVVDARIREKTDEIGLIRKTTSITEATCELRVFDINSGKEILTRKFDASVDDNTFRFYSNDRENKLTYRQELLRYAVRVAMRKAVTPLVEFASKLDWVGRVARIIGSKVYVNAGRKSGINVGDILKVMTEGEEVYDPESGALIGVSKGEVKGTLEVIDYFGPDGAISILHSGGTVIEGDYVQLY